MVTRSESDQAGTPLDIQGLTLRDGVRPARRDPDRNRFTHAGLGSHSRRALDDTGIDCLAARDRDAQAAIEGGAVCSPPGPKPRSSTLRTPNAGPTGALPGTSR